jgi:dipeptidyl aminopeptidase/acylaminoacyl peptidase
MTAPLTGAQDSAKSAPCFEIIIWQVASRAEASVQGGKFVKALLFRNVAVAALLSAAGVAAAQATHSLAEDAAAFGARPAVSGVSLSPDGHHVLYLTPGPGPKTYAVISDLASGTSNVVVSTDGKPEGLSWCGYSSQSRVVCSVYAIVDIMGWPATMSRKISMDTQGADAKLLSKADRSVRSSDGYILDWRQSVDGKVLMARTTSDGLEVDLVDTATLKSTTIERPNPRSAEYWTDHVGNIRIMDVLQRDTVGVLTGKEKYYYRVKGTAEWKDLTDFQKDEFEPLTIDTGLDELYALKKKDGRYALYRIKLDGSRTETFIAADPKFDIADVISSEDGKKVVGYAFSGDKTEKVYFDPQYKALSDFLSRALPKTPNISIADSTPDGSKLLIFAGSDQEPGRYYLFDRNAKSLNEAMLGRPELEKYQLAQMKPVTIKGAGGVDIPAYLTLPPGKNPKNLPAIVMPHGGPAARDRWGFDWLSQFFAQRGYAVIQPQFRGSTGFGDAWKNDSAVKNWRAAMIDVASSAQWLSAQGIADPKRVAIFGWSYGGYAALRSAELNPELYKAIIAVAPVTDFALIKEDANFTAGQKIIDDLVGGGIEMQRGSPLRNVSSIAAPVLLVHGTTDVNVPVRHSDKMAEALKSNGKQVEYLRFPGLDHQLPDATARSEMLAKAAELLDRTIGH